MTFAEILLFLLALVVLYFLLSPLQHYLEPRLRKLFHSKKKYNPESVIDITDYSRKKNNPNPKETDE
jgi:hypothetical protein